MGRGEGEGGKRFTLVLDMPHILPILCEVMAQFPYHQIITHAPAHGFPNALFIAIACKR